MIRRLLSLSLGALVAIVGSGVARAQTAPPAAKPAAVFKFLSPGDLDPATFLPPPPRSGSAVEAAERAELHRLASERTPERLARAQHDNDVEEAVSIANVLGPAFDLASFPATAKLLEDLHNEDSLAAKQAKTFFHRTRPFGEEPTLDVCDKGDNPTNSYPSGHATMGYAAAAVLANLMPGNAQLILARASDYAESRLYCGVHFRTDIVASQVLGNVLVVKLMEKPSFASELEAARTELTKAHIAP